MIAMTHMIAGSGPPLYVTPFERVDPVAGVLRPPGEQTRAPILPIYKERSA